MTVREEVGLEGVQALDGSLVTGSVLLNLDSEEDGRLTVGCAGSTDTWLRVERPREPVGAGRGRARRHGRAAARAATPGQNIAHGRSNAVKALGRALREAHAAVPFRLASFAGGKSRNAIPRDAARRLRRRRGPRGRLPRRDRDGRGGRSATRTRSPTRAST